MMTPSKWTSAVLLTGLVASALPAFSASAADPKPNLVFILIDDLGWADVGCFGSRYYETPNIDRLAAQGMRFTDAYAACPVCSPTRASIMTGKYPGPAAPDGLDSGRGRRADPPSAGSEVAAVPAP